MPAMLWTCLYLPDLCLQVFLRGGPQRAPIAVSSLSKRPDIVACNRSAEGFSVAPGMSVAAALSLVPELQLHLRDQAAESNALRAIAGWAGQFTPTISIAEPFGLLLEVSASLGYFRGFKNLLTRLESGLRELGWDAVLASSPVPTGALLLARAGLAIHTRGKQTLKAHLGALPLAFLASSEPHLDTLRGLGIASIEDLLKLPAEGVARRFGQALLDEIRRATGELPDAVTPFLPAEGYKNRIQLPSPVMQSEALIFVLKRLVAELAGFLRARGAGVTRLTVELTHEDLPPTRLIFGLAITRDVEHILRVMGERLARETLPDRVEAIALESTELSPLDSVNSDFFPGAKSAKEGHGQLLERLSARLGEEAVRAVRFHADHRPELACCCVPLQSPVPAGEKAPPASEQTASTGAARPLWLLPEPRPLAANPGALSLTLLGGPERIETGWWDGPDITRDYFVAHNQQGERCWLFRDKEGQWFLHGLFA